MRAPSSELAIAGLRNKIKFRATQRRPDAAMKDVSDFLIVVVLGAAALIVADRIWFDATTLPK